MFASPMPASRAGHLAFGLPKFRSLRRGARASLAITFLVLAGCAGNGGASGGTALQLPTASAMSPDCAFSALLPVKLARSGNAVVLLRVSDGTEVSAVWPAGFRATLAAGKAEVLASDGTVVAHEGDVLDNLGGGTDQNGTFGICSVGGARY